MDNLHIEITRKAIKTVLDVDDEPLLVDENLLISVELDRGIVYIPWLGIYKTFQIPTNYPNVSNIYYQDLRIAPLNSNFDQASCNSRLFCNSLENLITSSFLRKIDNCFFGLRGIEYKSETERIRNAFINVLNIPVNVYFENSEEDGVERFICDTLGFKITRSDFGCYIFERGIGEEPLIERIGLKSFSSLDESVKVLLNKIFSYRFRFFIEEIRCNKKYLSLVLN